MNYIQILNEVVTSRYPLASDDCIALAATQVSTALTSLLLSLSTLMSHLRGSRASFETYREDPSHGRAEHLALKGAELLAP